MVSTSGHYGAGIGGGVYAAGGNILITGESTVVNATGGGAEDIGAGYNGAAGNVFVAILEANLTLATPPATTANAVKFSADPASPANGTVTAKLPAPFNTAGAAGDGVVALLTSGLAPAGVILSVVTMFGAEDITFGLEDYISVVKKGMDLMDPDAATSAVAFAPVSTTVAIPAILGVTPPVAGAAPATSITATTEYSGAVSWTKADDTPFTGNFDYATAYKATIVLSPETGYTLTGVTADFFTVAGATSATNSADGGVISAVFPATANAPVIIIPNPDPDPAPDPTIYVTGVRLNIDSLEAIVGDDAVKLVATVFPRFATYKGVSWSTSDPLVATVDYDGVVNFVGAGTATITATTSDGGYTVDCVVRVGSDTGTEDVSASATLYAAASSDGLRLFGLVPGEAFRIYNVSGQLLFRGKATAVEAFVPLREHGVYVVTSGNRSVKAAY